MPDEFDEILDAVEGTPSPASGSEVVPDVMSEEPDALVPGPPPSGRVLQPLYGDALRDAAEPGYSFAADLQDAWGDEVFAGSAYAQAWEAEWRHRAQTELAQQAYLKAFKQK
jgi:hypothetical protein